MTTFKCESSTASKNGGFVNKMVAEQLMEVFGTKKAVRNTYYIKTVGAIKVGSEHKADLAQFDIVEREFVIPDGPSAGQVVALKWLTGKQERQAPVARYSQDGVKI